MNVKVLFFATIREKTGVKNVVLELPVNTNVAGFKQMLTDQYPSLADGMRSAIVSVNREFAFDDQTIPAGAELAVFPPVSGG